MISKGLNNLSGPQFIQFFELIPIKTKAEIVAKLKSTGLRAAALFVTLLEIKQ